MMDEEELKLLNEVAIVLTRIVMGGLPTQTEAARLLQRVQNQLHADGSRRRVISDDRV